jgi:hypothetical protein
VKEEKEREKGRTEGEDRGRGEIEQEVVTAREKMHRKRR